MKHYTIKILIFYLMLILFTENNFAQTKSQNSSVNTIDDRTLIELKDEHGNKLVDPELDAIQNSVFSGNSPLSKFGFSVSSAGDVNADGYDDIIIGEPDYLLSKGRAFIYFGGLAINTSPDVVFSGEFSQDVFGSSVSCAGDVNNDGFDDVIIGAYGNNSNTGKAYVYFGGNNMNNAADVILTGQNPNDKFGVSVSNAGDVDNNGYDDVIVGAESYNNSAGSAYIFYGGMNMDNVIDIQVYGNASNSFFGHCVSDAGDVNGDNYNDVIIGAYGSSFNSGSAFIFYGSASMDNTADVTITGILFSNLGRSVSKAGDVNNDGYSDVIVGGDYNGFNTGFAKIYLGSSIMDNVSDINLSGENSSDKFGWSVSGAGDMNGDGFDDVISGAPGFASGKGKMYVYYGATSMDQYSDVTKIGESTGSYFGYSVSNAGDFNSDGYSDILAGAYGMNLSMGKVYFYQYRSDPPRTLADLTLTGVSGSLFGIFTSDAGDVNGDGFSDLLVSAPNSNNSGRGRIFIFYGGPNMDNYPDYVKSGSIDGNQFGISVSGAGDVNGDGYDDIIIGSNSVGFESNGKADIFLGGANMDTVADVTMYEQQTGTRYGETVSKIGDINSDGYDDVIVGDMDYNSYIGRAYIYYGGANMNNGIDLILSGSSASQFGHSFAPAKDINGDGYSDLVVGARSYGSGLGRVYIYYGGPAVDNIADVILQGFVTGEEFGNGLASGDVNGDGYTDVICSAPFYNSYTGRMFLFYGGPSMDNTADKIFAGDTVSGFFGAYLTCADLNNDGYDDIISTSKCSNYGGKVNFYYGNENINTTSQFSITGGPYFGRAVKSVKDLNGDNVADLAISQSYSSDYVFIYFSRPEGNSKITFFGAIQGMYDPIANTEIPDTVTVILRKNISPYDIVDSAKNILLGPSAGQDFYFGKVHNNVPYYIQIRHRNSLETWSADPVLFSYQQTSIAFSVDAIYAFGNNEIQVDTSPYNVFAFYSGDVNHDGTIDASDLSDTDNDSFFGLSGYVRTDVTGDNFVDAADVSIVDNNAFNAVSVVRP